MIPFSISEITPQLYISGWPLKENAQLVSDMNFDLVIHLLWQRTDSILQNDETPVHRIIMIDSPITPLPIGRLIKGVELALPVIQDGGKVLVYCKSGMHRSMALATCILIASGYSYAEATTLINEKRPVAKTETNYIKKRILLFEKEWKKRHEKKH